MIGKRSFRNPFALEVHCWGGLGSQLYALAVAYELGSAKHKRKIQLVLHSSGVTMRTSEISHLDLPFSVKYSNDFSQRNSEGAYQRAKSHQKFTRKLLVVIFKYLRIILSDGDVKKVKPWTLQLRGHYTGRRIPDKVITELYSLFKDSNPPIVGKESSTSSIAIHYRLGDLIALNNKTYIDPDLLVNAIRHIQNSSSGISNEIVVYSDSPKFAEAKLISVSDEFRFLFRSKSTWDTIMDLVKYDYFIATNSKIGIWVTLFRSADKVKRQSLVPEQLRKAIEAELDDPQLSKFIEFY